MGDMTDDALERAEFGETEAMLDRLQAARRRAARISTGRAARFGTALHQQAERALTELAPWEPDPRFPSEPPVGSVLRWTVQYATGRELTVVGIRVAPGWYVSTNVHQGPLLWSRVRALIGDSPCSVAVEWSVIPQPEPEPSGDDAVRAWAEQYRPLGMVAERGTPVDQGDRPSWSVSTDGERAAERDAADLTVAAAEREAERPEPRYDADGRDRGGWTPAELGDTDAVDAQEDADAVDAQLGVDRADRRPADSELRKDGLPWGEYRDGWRIDSLGERYRVQGRSDI